VISKNYLEMTAIGVALAVSLGVVAPKSSAQSPGGSSSASQPKVSLDYDFFKERIAPIFLKKRSGHGRCYACHSGIESTPSRRDFFEKLPAGSDFWTEDQLRRIFTLISRYVTPGNPATSLLLLRPLAPEAGGGPPGSSSHRGGRQFFTKDDPDWQTLEAWVQGAKLDAKSDTSRDLFQGE